MPTLYMDTASKKGSQDMKYHRLFIWLFTFFPLLYFTTLSLIAEAQEVSATVYAAREKIEFAAGAPVEMTYSPVTGLATFVGTTAGNHIQSFLPSSAPTDERAKAFLSRFGNAFGIKARDQL